MEGAGAYNAWLFERARPHLGRRVLDAGAGVGTFTGLAADGREVVAVEPDPALLERLRSRFEGRQDVRVVEGTVEDVDGTFDAIVCLNVLEHIPDDLGALRRFHELLDTKNGLRDRLWEAGFEIAELRLVNPLGAAGWFVSSRVLKREHVPEGPLRLYDKLLPALRVLDKVDVGVGLSVWAVARR